MRGAGIALFSLTVKRPNFHGPLAGGDVLTRDKRPSLHAPVQLPHAHSR
jgi:hypothetical protein